MGEPAAGMPKFGILPRTMPASNFTRLNEYVAWHAQRAFVGKIFLRLHELVVWHAPGAFLAAVLNCENFVGHEMKGAFWDIWV